MTILLIILLLLIIILLITINYKKYSEIIVKENFFNNSSEYLYPVKKLGSECEKHNLYPAYMPQVCYIDGVLNTYANCKCQDKNGNCKICYDTIKKDDRNANVVYNANKPYSEY